MLNVTYNNISIDTEFIFVNVSNEQPLLSSNTCLKLGIFSNKAIVSNINNVCQIPKDLFEGIGNMKDYEQNIVLNKDATPKYFAPRRVSPIIAEKIRLQLKKLEDEGIIKKSFNSEWASPLVPVLKKNGDIRLCVDFRYLNSYLKRDFYQLPTIEDLLITLSGSKYFSSLDARSGYHQIPISEDSQHLLTFTSPFGSYKFQRLPFGIATAPEIYQKIMNEILADIDGVFCYLDDILIHSSDSDSHQHILERVFERLEKANIKLNKEKCFFL